VTIGKFDPSVTLCSVIRRLLLWDVDGTLLRAGEVGAVVFERALEDVLGTWPGERVRMSGKTDPQIVKDYLAQMGVDPSDWIVDAILARVESHLADAAATGELAAAGRACAGVAPLLEAISRDSRVVSSLLTGNIYANAALKVAAFGLDRWLDLDVGAYGSDHHDRDELVPIAIGRVEAEHGTRVDPAEVWVIGDTPRDLGCARAGGSRCLLVATGRYGADELAALGPDAVFEDLTDTDTVLKLLLGDLPD
jgi:phosphoglycolate phosphatase-like HAD superfamily hydrolase